MEFVPTFGALTDLAPYAWQERLYQDWFSVGKIPPAVQLPTGTGKTRIMAIWLLALAGGARLPRRLVWVVDRRAVVDQATAEAERLRRALGAPALKDVRDGLRKLSLSGPEDSPVLGISTLRGAFADNREWSDDPSRPAIVVGTVDMVGSRLLFSGYGDGRYHRPLHAGLLGIDSLAVLDEAHLSRPFEHLLRRVEDLQSRGKGPLPRFRFLPLSATMGKEGGFQLSPAEREEASLVKILSAPKHLAWHRQDGSPASADEFRSKIVERALRYRDSTARVVVYLDRLKDVQAVLKHLSRETPGRVAALTGTLRGHERDQLVRHPVFSRFLASKDSGKGVAYLVSTSAGEVGIDLYADQMVCDLVPADRMIQRFGRVNRSGEGNAMVDLCPQRAESPHPARQLRRAKTKPDGAGLGEMSVARTEQYLNGLAGVSPGELERSPPPEEAFAPVPAHPPLRTWLLDAWSLTTSPRDELPVERWLRGIDESAPPDVYFAWRQETEVLADPQLLDDEDAALFLQEYRLLPRELLRQSIGDARRQLDIFKERVPEARVLVLSPGGEVELRGRVLDVIRNGPGDRLAFRTILFPSTAGGIDENGMLDASRVEPVLDVSAASLSNDRPAVGTAETAGRRLPSASEPRDHGWLTETEGGWEVRLFGRREQVSGRTREEALRKARTLTGLESIRGFPLQLASEDAPRRELLVLRSRTEPGSQADSQEMLLVAHSEATGRAMGELSQKLGIQEPLAAKVLAAALSHDRGKARRVWQEYSGGYDPSRLRAKSASYLGPEALGGYRHELGSLIDLGGKEDPLVQHLIAAHHGYGRPGFTNRATDREHPKESLEHRRGQLRRFAELQREHGWWGLAYLEALVKAADMRGSR